jgi:hypothetical protein
MEFDRRPRNLKGILVSTALDLFGAKIYAKQLGETLRRLEAAGEQSPPPRSDVS